MELIRYGQEIYLLENGVLKNMGRAGEAVRVFGNVYTVDDKVFKKDGDNFECIARDSCAERIWYHASVKMPDWAKFFSSARCAIDLKEVNPLLSAKYLEIIEKRHKAWYKADGGIVIFKGSKLHGLKDPKLFFDGKGFRKDFGSIFYPDCCADIDELDEESVLFFGTSSFIYGYRPFTNVDTFRFCDDIPSKLSIQNGCWTKVDQALMLTAKNYMIFFAGENYIFALEQNGDKTMIKLIGNFEESIKTEVNDLFIVNDAGKSKLYHLGENLEFVACLNNCNKYSVSNKTGNITMSKVSQKISRGNKGVNVVDEIECVFENGHYRRVVNQSEQ